MSLPKVKTLITSLLSSIFAIASALASPYQTLADFSGQVVGVTDGDSLRVMHNGRAEQVRLQGVDCPEKGQAFGQRAKKAASDLAFGQTVMVNPISKDKYGRTVATVVLTDGKVLNHELVKRGWCWWFRKYAPSDTELEAFEQAARQAKKGLWIDPRPVPPWEFRKARRSPKHPSPSASASGDRIHTGIVGNHDSQLYHRPECPSYEQIAPQNRVEFASEVEAEAAGYRLAGNCP